MSEQETKWKKLAEKVPPMSEEKQARLEQWEKSTAALKAEQKKLETKYKEKTAEDKRVNSPKYKEKEEFNAKKREDTTTLHKEKAMNSFFEHGKALPGDTAKQLTEKGDKIEGKDLDALVGVIDSEIKSYRKKVDDVPVRGVFSPDDLKGAEKRRLQDIINNGGLPEKAKAYIKNHYNITDEKEATVQK